MVPSSPSETPSVLISAIESRYSPGDAAGQLWLEELCFFLRGLPVTDPRLVRLAATGAGTADDYLRLDPRPIASHLNPSVWLDAFVEWSTGVVGVDG
jgi:hypothetical protein